MTLRAIDDIDDAIDATRAFLWPFDLRRWAKLAFVVFFLGGFGTANPTQFTGGGNTPTRTPPSAGETGIGSFSGLFASIGQSEWLLIGAVVGAILLIALVFGFVGAVMEFVFVESLRNERVSIRAYWSERWRQGARLFGFRLGVGLLSLLLTGGVLVAGFWPLLAGNGGLSLVAVAISVLIVIALAVVFGLLNGFTTQFVVPVMIAEDRPVLAAWRRFWPTMTGQWKEYLAYAFMRFVLQIAAGILVGVVTVVVAIAVAIPLGVVGLVGFGMVSLSEIAGGAVIALAVVLFVLALLVLSLVVAVPVQTFLRYYALLMLGDTNDAFDLLPERRRAIRE